MPAPPAIVTAATRPALLARFRDEMRALAAEVDATRHDRAFRQALDTLALFWRYSPFNQWLIRHQFPRARIVAGRRTWEKAGRRVKGGAQPIAIFAPTSAGFPFVLVPVFDVSQTRGRRLPVLDTMLRGRTKQVRVLEEAARRLGIEVVALPAGSPILGCSEGGRVRVREELSDRERAATLAHELAHEVLHMGAAARKRRVQVPEVLRETEAEATAYAVLRVLGLPSKAPAYIAWRGGEGRFILASFGRIQRAARVILEATTESMPARRRQA